MTDHTLKTAAESFVDAARSSVEDLKTTAADAAGKMREATGQRVDAVKDTLADEGVRLAETLRKSAAGLGDGTLQDRVMDMVATGVADLSEKMRGRNMNDVLADAQNFARRNPGIFIAGAALAGFALARFARSGTPSHGGAPLGAATNQVPSGPNDTGVQS